MRAITIPMFGGADVLQLAERPDPTPSAREVLVHVRASALNRADLLQRLGRYPAPPGAPPDIPGIEFAGEVVASGATAARWKPGARVFGIVGGGAHAELLTVHEDAIAPIPDRLSWAEAGAVPEAFITAYDALVTQARLAPGERVLIHAVGSGVGLAACGIVRAWGAEAFGTSRTPDKIVAAKAHGLVDGLAVGEDLSTLPAQVAAWTGGRGVDVVLDLTGGPYVGPSLASLAPRGRMMLVGAVAGAQATVDVRLILSRRLTLMGTVLRSRSLEEKIEVTRAFARDVVPRLARGELQPTIDSVFPLARAGEAHRRMESNASVGKVVLEVSS